jgi:uncharacterized membrane protein
LPKSLAIEKRCLAVSEFPLVALPVRILPTMPYCPKCGAELASDASPCPKCHPADAVDNTSSGQKGELGLDENIAGLLCYAGLWVTGLVFFLIDKRPSVRFHAAQSMVVFGGLQIADIILEELFVSIFRAFSLGGFLLRVLQLLGLVLWILLMIKAYQGERFRVPIAADIADSLLKK